MYCVGLTGNIACGKTSVSSLFKQRGIDVINADDIARELTAPDQAAFHLIETHFGNTVISASGELNRKALRQLIFTEPAQRLWLEQLLHPLIRQKIKHKIAVATSPYCLIEIPLLFNRAEYDYLNRILLVSSTAERQIQRLIKRDNSSRDQALAILAVQPDDATRRLLADDIIENNDTLAELQQAVEKLHDYYLQQSQELNK